MLVEPNLHNRAIPSLYVNAHNQQRETKSIRAERHLPPPNPEPNPIQQTRISRQNEINRYQTLRTIARVIKAVGVISAFVGIGAAAFFFSVPVITVATTTVFFTGPLFFIMWGSVGLFDVELYNRYSFNQRRWEGVYRPGAVSIATSIIKEQWQATASVFYNPMIATYVGIGCGIITGVGGLLFAAGTLTERYCNRKIRQLNLLMANQAG